MQFALSILGVRGGGERASANRDTTRLAKHGPSVCRSVAFWHPENQRVKQPPQEHRNGAPLQDPFSEVEL